MAKQMLQELGTDGYQYDPSTQSFVRRDPEFNWMVQDSVPVNQYLSLKGIDPNNATDQYTPTVAPRNSGVNDQYLYPKLVNPGWYLKEYAQNPQQALEQYGNPQWIKNSFLPESQKANPEATAEHYRKVFADYDTNVKEAKYTGGYVDDWGRLWNPGSTVQGKGGKYTYTGKQEPLGDNQQERNVFWDNPAWEWTADDPKSGITGDGQAFERAGVYNPGPDKGSGWNQGISTWVSAFGPMLTAGVGGALSQAGGATGSLGGSSISASEAIASGATASDMASMGFSTADIAMNSTALATNELIKQGVNPTLASMMVKGGTGALSGAGLTALKGGNVDQILNSALTGGVSGGASSGLSSLGSASNSVGDNMDGYDFSNGVDYAGLDEVGGFNAGNTPEMDPNISYTGDAGGSFFGITDWNKLIPTAAGIGLGIYGQMNNNAAAAAGQQAQQNAITAQTAGANNALQLQREQFEYQKKLNEPFYNKGLSGFEQYASAITGKPGPDGKVWSPTETPAYTWQKQQLDKNMGRTLRSLGRENSTYGMNVVGDQTRSLEAGEYDKQLGRLADLTNIARGGASTLTSSSGTYGANAGNMITANANNQANASLAGGLMQQNNLYNNNQNLMSLANLGLKAYQGYKNGDWTTGG